MRALASQFVQVARLPGLDHVEFGAEHSQHGQQLARAEFGRAAAFETRERFGGDARLRGHVGLLQPEAAAPGSDGFTEFLEGLHLIFISISGVMA